MKRDVAALAEGAFDLLILGGGISGAGVALDATLRGLRVALIDKGDFASGTSSISSKLVHGGLRYLEHGDFRLVYEALHERARLLRNAPHLVWPLRFVLPFYEGDRVPPWKWRLGLTLYDVLAGAGNLSRSRPLSRGRMLHELAGLRPDGLVGGAQYFDAQMDDARLCVEVVGTAALHGARVANYVEAVAFDIAGGQIRGVTAHDNLSGSDLTIRARQVLNATGPWGDHIRTLAGEGGAPLLRPTKGVHLVCPGRNLRAALLLLHPADGRVFFVIPWMGKTLLGTTDTEAPEPPDELGVTADDERYLLEGYNRHFSPALSSADVLGRFVGVRPLLAESAAHFSPALSSADVLGRFVGVRPLLAESAAPSARSREFHVTAGPTGLLTVAGGKYTTFRHMAEVITDKVCARLHIRRRCRTRDLPLAGTPVEPWPEFAATAVRRLGATYGLRGSAAWHLVRRYGRLADDVAAYVARDGALAAPVVAGEPDLLAEFAYQRDHEMAHRPADFLLRRTRLGLFRPDLLGAPPALVG
jgi:glycerol-3-phosphate dehydrogenase